MSLSRRRFVTAATTAAAAAGLGLAARTARGDAKIYRTALIGSGWWGMNILRCAMDSGQCKTVALCDVDEKYLNSATDEVQKKSGDGVNKYKDYRELLQREKPDIAIIGTPDHWHPLMMIAAVRAGAHVYVEKPICHTINEGRAMVKAARETGKIVQVGTHRRVSPHNVSGMEFLKSGKAGQIGMVRAFVHYGGGAGTKEPDSDVPAGLDWDMWCGPAPYRPFNKRIHPKGFRNFLDYANGQLGDWGIHWMDQILWWTEEKWPRHVYSTGGRHIARDNSDGPDTQVVSFKFDSFTAEWEHRKFASNEAEKHNVGCYFYGTEGTFHMGWTDGWTFYPVNNKKAPIHVDAKLNQPDGQNIKELFADFLQSIQSGKRPVCDIEIGQRSTNMSLLGMLSLKLGRSVEWDGAKEQIVDDSQANKLLSREYRKPWEYPKV